jgi:threonine dehydrogenase-like Zn-dependent dehydrogenase
MIVHQMINLTHIGGEIGQVGVWIAQDDSLEAPLEHLISPSMNLPLSDFFLKRLKLQGGPVGPKELAPFLVR